MCVATLDGLFLGLWCIVGQQRLGRVSVFLLYFEQSTGQVCYNTIVFINTICRYCKSLSFKYGFGALITSIQRYSVTHILRLIMIIPNIIPHNDGVVGWCDCAV